MRFANVLRQERTAGLGPRSVPMASRLWATYCLVLALGPPLSSLLSNRAIASLRPCGSAEQQRRSRPSPSVPGSRHAAQVKNSKSSSADKTFAAHHKPEILKIIFAFIFTQKVSLSCERGCAVARPHLFGHESSFNCKNHDQATLWSIVRIFVSLKIM